MQCLSTAIATIATRILVHTSAVCVSLHWALLTHLPVKWQSGCHAAKILHLVSDCAGFGGTFFDPWSILLQYLEIPLLTVGYKTCKRFGFVYYKDSQPTLLSHVVMRII